jgi:hypothetical protein
VLRRTQSTPRAAGFARLDLGRFYEPVKLFSKFTGKNQKAAAAAFWFLEGADFLAHEDGVG